jgi:cytochrome c-type biogenesis protein CcmF
MQISTLGNICLLVLFLLALGTAALAIVGAHRRSDRLVEGAIAGVHGTFATSLLATLLLVYAFLAGDTSIQYVQHNSNSTMPVLYKITSLWGDLDGSLLFWTVLLALFSSLAVRQNRDRHRALIPHAIAVLAIITAFFGGLLVFMKGPFEPFLLAVPSEGRGLNPLLQNPYMVTHPPALYLGYVSLAVPYAFAMAAMITGQVDSAWQRSVRRWVLFSWLLLGAGLVLGGLWAYEELGWGGYWGWDPVENAGLLPWLTCTALLHSVMIQERRGMLKVWNLVLVIVSFLLTIVGTFLTRTGVVQSVHAFGRDAALAWAFGAFMAAIVLVSFGLLVWRLPRLRARNELESLISREFAFLVNNWLFLVASLFVLLATLYPTITEIVDSGQRVTIGPPFYDHYMRPVGLALLLLTGFGPLVAWRKTSGPALARQFLWPVAVGVVAAIVPATVGVRSPWGLACFGLCGFTSWTIVQEFSRGVVVRRRQRPQSVLEALVGLVVRARRRYGGYIVHLGVVLMFVGFAGRSYELERNVGMYPGEHERIGPYEIRHDGIRAGQDWQKDMLVADLAVLEDGEHVATLSPAKWWYHERPEQPTTEASRHMTLAEDVYAAMQEADRSTGRIELKLFINPLVNWVWIGFAVMLLGGTVCLGTRRGEASDGA